MVEWLHLRGTYLSGNFGGTSTFTEPFFTSAISDPYLLFRYFKIPSLFTLAPIIHVSRNELRSLLRRVLSPQGLNKVAIGIHQVKVNAVIDEVILSRLDVLGRAEVDAVLLTQRLDLLVSSGQADELGVELGQVLLQSCRVVARGIAGDEDGEEGGIGDLRFDNVEHLSHLVELFGADVGASGEAKVDLQTRSLAM